MMTDEFNEPEIPVAMKIDSHGSAPTEMRCVQCDSPVYNIVCGRKSPCPTCGFPYPIGDCSDLAEN